MVNEKQPPKPTSGVDRTGADSRLAARPGPARPPSRGLDEDSAPAAGPGPDPDEASTLPERAGETRVPVPVAPGAQTDALRGALGGTAPGQGKHDISREAIARAPAVPAAAAPAQPGALAPPPTPGPGSHLGYPEAAVANSAMAASRPASAVPGSTGDGSKPNPATAAPRDANPLTSSISGTVVALAAGRAPARAPAIPGAEPSTAPGAGANGARAASDTRSNGTAPLPAIGVAVEPDPVPAPDIPTVPAGGRSSAARQPAQSVREFDLAGLAGSAAAAAKSSAGPAQSLASALPPNPAGAELARAAAPQIAAAIGAGSGSGRIELRLDPPELGKVEILLDIADQSLRATLAAERTATGELLRRHGDILAAQLKQAGFSDIDLHFAGSNAGADGHPGSGEALQRAFFNEPGSTENRDPVDGKAGPPTGRDARRGADGLDLRL